MESEAPRPMPAITTSYETLAFHYWVENYVFRVDELPEFGHEYLQYVLYYWNRTRPGSSLHLALSAVSLAVFGKARGVGQAVEDAERIHEQTIVSTKKVMSEVSDETIDQLLLAIMLMGFYEVFRDRSDSRLAADLCRISCTIARNPRLRYHLLKLTMLDRNSGRMFVITRVLLVSSKHASNRDIRQTSLLTEQFADNV
jgi:hypothetical protein